MEEIKFFPKEDVCFHLSALKKLAIVDGVFHDSEKRIIDQIAQMYISFYPDLDFETVQKMDLSEDEYNQGLEKLKQNPFLSRLLLKDLITLGYVDGAYSELESEMVRDTAQKLNVSEDRVRLLEKAVDDLNRATLFMNNVLFS